MDPLSIVAFAFAVAGFGELCWPLLRAVYKKLVQGQGRGAHPPDPNTSCRKAQLQSDLSGLCHCVKKLHPQSQVQKILLEQLLASAKHSLKFLERPNEQLYPQDIEDCRELFVFKFQQHVQRAIHQSMKKDDIQSRISTQETIVKGMMDRMPADQRNMNIVNIILQHDDPVLVEFVQEMHSVLEYKHYRRHSLPLLQDSKARQDGAYRAKEVDRGVQGGRKATPQIKMVGEQYKTAMGMSDKGNLLEHARSSNPNCKMRVVALEGDGNVQWRPYQGNQWKVTYQAGRSNKVRILRAEEPMQVCSERGFMYCEVKLVKMVELDHKSSETRQAGVGVGFAHEVRSDKVAGWYRESYGYDGRVLSAYNAYCEGNICDFQIGPLLRGDTLGIGLLTQPGGAPIVFFTKNGDLRGCISNSRLARYASNLYPVISLDSMHVEVMVNFNAPFHLPWISEIVVAGKKATR